MCAVSAIFDHGRSYPLEWWDAHKYDQYKSLIEQAKQFDQSTGQPDCEDIAKTALLERIEKRLADIEKKLDVKAA